MYYHLDSCWRLSTFETREIIMIDGQVRCKVKYN